MLKVTLSKNLKQYNGALPRQEKNYWFGSWKTGLYKYDGKTLINYTTKHGLYTDRVDDIEEDQSGNIYFTGMNQILLLQSLTENHLPISEQRQVTNGNLKRMICGL
jgi:ligand-binding sensor domain-containing protein